MEILNPKDAFSFLQICQKALEENEVNSNQILGISNTLFKNNYAYGTNEPFYSIAMNNNDISLIGLMTPPKNLLLYEHKNLNTSVMELFVNNLYTQYKSIPGVTGEMAVVKSFLNKWSIISAVNYKISKNLRIYKLTKVSSYNKPDGIFRCAEKNDIEIIANFISEFSVGIGEPIDIERAEEVAENGIADREIFIWENKNIVSMAKKQRPTKHGMAVSYVFTPVEYRCKGYATAVVAELSQNILDSGKLFCTLYTDLSNPTSNSIYQKIGYNPVCDNISYILGNE
jgi:predicted GNAT family acetyltransferase